MYYDISLFVNSQGKNTQKQDFPKLFPNYDKIKTIRKIKTGSHTVCLHLNP